MMAIWPTATQTVRKQRIAQIDRQTQQRIGADKRDQLLLLSAYLRQSAVHLRNLRQKRARSVAIRGAITHKKIAES